MRIKVGHKYISRHGDNWTVTKLNHPHSGRLQVTDQKGNRLDVDASLLGHHAKKVGLFSRLFGKGKK